MKCKQVALIVNPRTGKNITRIADILAVLAAAGWRTDLSLKEYGGQAMDLAADAASAGSDLVIAYGGDGTLNQVVNGVLKTKKKQCIVGVIPGGTANVWAGEIQVPDDPVKASLALTSSVVRKVDVGHVEVQGIELPTLLQNQQKQNSSQKRRKRRKIASKGKGHFLLMAGLGIDAAIMGHVSKDLKYQIGPLAVGASALKELPKQQPFPVEIQVGDEEVFWKGEALQVVIGNTRRYADVLQMTSEAFIDDGRLDVCVVTSGNPLTTMQQIVSLLLRHKPDTLTAEYFHGAHFSISVPAYIALQLDGSAVKLKDYLSKSDRKTLTQMDNPEQVMITYRFDALPHALQVAIPPGSDETLFSDKTSLSDSTSTPLAENESSDEAEQHKQAPAQEQQPHSKLEQLEASEAVKTVLSHGRQVQVVGVGLHPSKKNTFIVAGSISKQSTGEARPVAVCLDKWSVLRGQTGELLSLEAVSTLHEGEVIVVEGKKSRRGVIYAKEAVMNGRK
jgi:YegS/Rv2252/BmrU family lipid kinase